MSSFVGKVEIGETQCPYYSTNGIKSQLASNYIQILTFSCYNSYINNNWENGREKIGDFSLRFSQKERNY